MLIAEFILSENEGLRATQDAWLVDTLSVDGDRRQASAHTTTFA